MYFAGDILEVGDFLPPSKYGIEDISQQWWLKHYDRDHFCTYA